MPRFIVGFAAPEKYGWESATDYPEPIGGVYFQRVIMPFIESGESAVSLVDLKDAHEEYAASESAEPAVVEEGRAFIEWCDRVPWRGGSGLPDKELLIIIED